MNQQHAHNLSTSDFVRMFECDAKSELELALFSRLVDYMGQDDSLEQFNDIFGAMEEVIETAEENIDTIVDNHGDNISDPVATILDKLQISLSETRETQREIYENLDYVE